MNENRDTGHEKNGKWLLLGMIAAMLLCMETAHAIEPNEEICGVTFGRALHVFADASGKEILSIDSSGNVYARAPDAAEGGSPPEGVSGVAFEVSGSVKWLFNSTNAYVSGSVVDRAQIPGAGNADVLFMGPSGTPLALMQGSSGDMLARGVAVYDGGSAGCPDDDKVCWDDGNVHDRRHYCNVTRASKGTCEYELALYRECVDGCVDSDMANDVRARGYVNDTDPCSSGAACPYDYEEDFCDSGGLLHDKTCTDGDEGGDYVYDCNQLDGCSGNSYLDYSCSAGACSSQSIGCQATGDWNGNGIACNCVCGPYDVEETGGAYCSDGLDNDCDGTADVQDRGCCSDGCNAGSSECQGNSKRTCGNYDQDPCLEWSGWDDCSDCSCNCGPYGKDESITNGNCDDGKDNDCDGGVDYDGGGAAAEGDPGCPVSIQKIDIKDNRVCPKESETIEAQCTASVAGVGCVKAAIGGAACSAKGWSLDKALFDCAVGSYTTELCGAGSSYTATCAIDTAVCAKSGEDKSVNIYAMPGTCEKYNSQGACAAGGCQWCLQCSGTKWSGRSKDVCVEPGGCTYNCVFGYCTAGCDMTPGGGCQGLCDGSYAVKMGCDTVDCACKEASRTDCNGMDQDNCWLECNAGTGNVDRVCDDWACGGGSCTDSGGDWVMQPNAIDCTVACDDPDGSDTSVRGTTTDTQPCQAGATECTKIVYQDYCNPADKNKVNEYACVSGQSSSNLVTVFEIECGHGLGCMDSAPGKCSDCDDDDDGWCEIPYDSPGDCDDTDARRSPGNAEACSDGIDNDCDGFTDCADSDCVSACTYTVLNRQTGKSCSQMCGSASCLDVGTDSAGTNNNYYNGRCKCKYFEEIDETFCFCSGGTCTSKTIADNVKCARVMVRWTCDDGTCPGNCDWTNCRCRKASGPA